jgi:hypothetical protein
MAARQEWLFRLGMAGVVVSLACALTLGYHIQNPSALSAKWLGIGVWIWGGAAFTSVICVSLSRAPSASRLWLGYSPLLLYLPFLMGYPFIALNVHHEYQSRTPSGRCVYNQRQISLALLMYAQDHQDRLAANWATLDIDARILRCPAAEDAGYGLNAAVLDMSWKTFDDPATLLLTADAHSKTSYLHSTEEIDWQRHGETDKFMVASFLDGHVATIRRADDIRLR